MIGEAVALVRAWRIKSLAPEGLRDLQNALLRELVAHACASVPYYTELFRTAGIRPQDIRTVDDLSHVPITTKQQLKAAGDAATIARGVDPAQCLRLPTSGSTGRPFQVTMSHADGRRRQRIEFRNLVSTGFRSRDRLVVLGAVRDRRPRLNDRLGLYATRVVSGTLSPEEQLRRLEQISPDVLWFYPSTMRGVLRAAGGALPKSVRPRVLISSSEVLHVNLEEEVTAHFGVRPLQFYGSIETGRISAECPARRGMHIQSDGVVVESWNGDRPAAAGEPGTAVVTVLWNRTMPFIRYRLGDVIELTGDSCTCGSHFPMMRKPLGRDNDVVRLAGGRVVAPLVFGFALRNFAGIDQFRVTQEALDRFSLALASRRPWADDALDAVRNAVREVLRANVEIDVKIVESLPEEPGKLREFISKVPSG